MATKSASTKGLRRTGKPAADPRSIRGASMLCAWHIGDGIWHVQSRDPWLSRVLRDQGMRRVAYAVIGGHLTIYETTEGIDAVKALMRRHKGRILK